MEEWERTAALFKIKFSTGIGENERMACFQKSTCIQADTDCIRTVLRAEPSKNMLRFEQ